jgi:phosphoglycerate dehydrogenase-like enzyme
MRVAVAIHDLPVWTIPASQVDRLARLMPGDTIVDARDADARRRAFADADIAFATKMSADEFAIARHLKWVHSSAVGIGPILSPALVASPVSCRAARVHSPAMPSTQSRSSSRFGASFIRP